MFHERSVERHQDQVPKDRKTSVGGCDNYKEVQTILLRAECHDKDQQSYSPNSEEVTPHKKDGVLVSGFI